jgi:hypothetical protein
VYADPADALYGRLLLLAGLGVQLVFLTALVLLVAAVQRVQNGDTEGSMAGDPPSKKEQLLKLLDRGSVFVHLDPRRESVIVPDWLSHKPQLVLQLGRNFAIPIPDLEIDEFGVSCTLSFNRTPFHCTLPWSAVYALVAENGEVTVWPSELPMELVPEASPVHRQRQP